jgi:hypothetical protein
MSNMGPAKRDQTDVKSVKVIACATVIEEMLPLMPPGMLHETLDFGLHIDPQRLRVSLQEAIDSTDPGVSRIVLGYGLCARAVVGLKAGKSQLIVPRVEDCTAIFLGSDAEYRKQHRETPGTYYLTKGWIEVGSNPFDDYDSMVQRYGKDRALHLMKRMLNNYTRLALINTGKNKMDFYRTYTRRHAERFGLEFEEITGSDALVRKMLNGPYDSDFVVANHGETISFHDFKKA